MAMANTGAKFRAPYRLFTWSSLEPVDTVEMHVLARAYHAAWRSLYASNPISHHVVTGVDLLIDFGDVETTSGRKETGATGDASTRRQNN